MYSLAIPYVVFVFILFSLSFPIWVSKNSQVDNISCMNLRFIAVTMCFIFFCGFRGFIWTDFNLYYLCFDSMPTVFSNKQVYDSFFNSDYFLWDKGYLLYVYIIKSIAPNYFAFQIINTTIDYFILYHVFRKNCGKNYLLGFVLFFLFNGFVIEFNLLRNTKALMLFILSLDYLKEKKYKVYYILNLIGVSFHFSAVLFLLIGFLLTKKLKKSILILFLVGNIIYLLQIQWLQGILSFIADYLPHRIGLIIKAYLYSMQYSKTSNFGISIGYLERIFSFILVYKKADMLEEKYNVRVFINCFYFFIFTYLFCSELNIVIQRIPLLFASGYYVVYPLIVDNWNKEKKIIFYLIFMLYLLLKVLSYGSNNELCHYEMFFQDSALTYEEASNRLYRFKMKALSEEMK